MKVSFISGTPDYDDYSIIYRYKSIHQAFQEKNINSHLYLLGQNVNNDLLDDISYEMINPFDTADVLYGKIYGSDIVIIDSIDNEIEVIESIYNSTEVIVSINSSYINNHPSMVYLDYNFQEINITHYQNSAKSYLLGPNYTLLLREFWREQTAIINTEISSLLLILDEDGIKGVSAQVLNILKENYSSLRKRIIITKYSKDIDEIINLIDDKIEIIYSPSTEKRLRLMLECDIAFCATERILYELACIGIPTIAIDTKYKPIRSLEGWIKYKFLLSKILYEDKDFPTKILNTMNDYKNFNLRFELSHNGKNLIDGLGSQRLIQHLIDIVVDRKGGFYLRNPNEKDAMIVFNLANERLVRKNSISVTPIKWHDHIKWFSEKISDENTLFYLAFDSNEKFIGQVRFDIRLNSSYINVSLTVEFREKKLSVPIIKNSCVKCFLEKPNIETIIALIKQNNIPSIKSFTKAGFLYSKEEIIKTEKYLVYVLYKN